MARVVGPVEAQRTIQVLNRRTGLYGGFPNRKVTWYTDAAGTQLADIRSYSSAQPSTVGAAIAGSITTLDAAGRTPAFWFPDGTATLYGRVSRGPIVSVTGDLQDASSTTTVIDVRDYGAVGDGTTDDTAAVQAAFAAANATARVGVTGTIVHPGATVHLRGRFNLATLAAAVPVRCNVVSEGAELIAPPAYAGTVLTVGHTTSGSILQAASIQLPDVIKGSGATVVTGSIGVAVQNLDNSNLSFGRVAYYETGVHLTGLGNGTAYNTIFLGWISYAKVALRIKPLTGGWANQNTFVGGGIQQSAGFFGGTRLSGYRHVEIDGASINKVDGNTFVGVSFEGDVSEHCIYLKDAFQNQFLGCRFEAGTAYTAVTVSGASITATGHGLVVGDMIVPTATVEPGGMNSLTPYYVVGVADANTFSISRNKGGTAITFTSAGTSVRYARPHRVYCNTAGVGVSENTIRNSVNPLGSLDLVHSSAIAGGNTVENTTYRTSNLYAPEDLPMYRARNAYSGAPVRPLFAAYSSGSNPAETPDAWSAALSDRGLVYKAGTVDLEGSGSPEGVATAPPGSTYRRRNGSVGSSLWLKTTGTGNTGWIPASTYQVVNVKDYGAKGDGVTDDTTAIRAALAVTTANRYYFPAGDYVVSSVAEGTTLGTFTNRSGIMIDAATATITNPTSYTNDTITAAFLFDNCKDVQVSVGSYVGFTLPTPTSHLGYRGTTLVRLINGCDGAKIDARITNARYGLQSGEYADETKGYCRNIDVRLRTSFCGYPIALYLAENVTYEIEADDFHRVAYLAGCLNVKGRARWKNQYIADIVTLITDAKTGTGTSRASAQLDLVSIDKGSTIFQGSTMCAGIALSRVDPGGIVYENIKVKVHSVGTDTVSSTVGAFTITSGAKTLTTPVADYNWEPAVVLRNISISGVIDKSAQTIASNTAGTIFCRAYDTLVAHSATIENLIYEDLVIKESAGVTRMCYLEAPGIVGSGVMFRNVSAPSATLEILTNTTVPVTMVNSVFKELNIIGVTGGSRVELVDSTIGAITGTANIGNTSSVNSRIAGAGALIRQKQWLLDLTSGATVTQASAIPANVLVLGVTGYITTTVTGPTTLQVGVTGDPARYLSTTTLTAGTGLGLDKRASTEQVPWYAPSTASSLVATAVGGNFTAGQIRLSLSYIELPAPTA